MLVSVQEVGFMSLNGDTLGNGLMESLQSQRDVSNVKLAQQTKVGEVGQPYKAHQLTCLHCCSFNGCVHAHHSKSHETCCAVVAVY